MNITKEAKAAYDREYRAKHKTRIAAAKRAYGVANPERVRATAQAWAEKNRERSREIKNAWKVRNPDADRVAGMSEERRLRHVASSTAYAKANPAKVNAVQRMRRAKVSHATPPWADMAVIKAFYIEARAKGLHVDHIIPIKGKFISGLHVHNNLQLMTPRENRIKGNYHAN